MTDWTPEREVAALALSVTDKPWMWTTTAMKLAAELSAALAELQRQRERADRAEAEVARLKEALARGWEST